MSMTEKNRFDYRNQTLVDESQINQCEDGYTGLLCSSCDRQNNYYKAGLIVCRKCPNNYVLQFVIRHIFNILWFSLITL